MSYTPPMISEIGSLRDLTLYKNKIGPTADLKSTVIVGSVVNVP